MANRLIEFRCAYLGRKVVLFDDRWRHAQLEHPEFAGTGMLEASRETLVDPDFITDDGKGDPDTKVAYYRRAPYPYGGQLIKAPVQVSRWRGKVMTFHLTPSAPPMEVVLWRRT